MTGLKKVYVQMQSILKKSPKNKILCLSATPIINNPYEIAVLFNLIRPKTFPDSIT